jgi:hypothetical protein
MSADKPLHVQVAEVLGWSSLSLSGRLDRPWVGYPPKLPIVGSKELVPNFDIDWAATGPLIEQYRLRVSPIYGAPEWIADSWKGGFYEASGLTPLIAVCNLILKLAEGKKL